MWQSGYVERDGLKLHYTRTGGSKPPIILLHGITDSGLCWKPVAAMLEADYDVIMVDARGHGQSDVPETDYGWMSHAEDVHRVLVGLGLEKPLILGHSMGALAALLFAGQYPDLPGALLLEDPPALWMPAAESAALTLEREAGFREWLSSLKTKTAAELIAEQHQQNTRWSDDELEPWADSKLRVSMNVLHIFKTNQDWSPHLHGIPCPVLLITADPEQGAAVTPEAAVQLRALVPQVQIKHIADAGHNIRREQFEAYKRIVTDFLNTL